MSGLNPRPLVLCGPSGSGKTTLLNRLLVDFPNKFEFSISHTTRKPRPGEVDGKNYHFTTVEKMQEDIKKGLFIESAQFCGNLYGTSKSAVEDVMREGKICVLDIDAQGVKQIKKTNLNPWYVFIKPPSVEVLKIRLIERRTETNESLEHRLSVAKAELEYGETPGNFDLVIVNDSVEHAYAQLKEFIETKVLKEED